jgi:hypothetical protein
MKEIFLFDINYIQSDINFSRNDVNFIKQNINYIPYDINFTSTYNRLANPGQDRAGTVLVRRPCGLRPPHHSLPSLLQFFFIFHFYCSPLLAMPTIVKRWF